MSNAVIIAVANSFFSVIAGFAIFGVSGVYIFLLHVFINTALLR